jgi:hypothetical protein
VAQEFPARPSALPDIRDFFYRQLATTPLSADQSRAVGRRVAAQVLDAAGVSAVIRVSIRVFPGWVEVDIIPA